MKPIRLSNHASLYIERRGFSLEEVETAIRRAPWTRAEHSQARVRCSIEFAYGREWNGKTYKTKRVSPIFVEDETEIVVVTV